jgi:hypothetical protein
MDRVKVQTVYCVEIADLMELHQNLERASEVVMSLAATAFHLLRLNRMPFLSFLDLS